MQKLDKSTGQIKLDAQVLSNDAYLSFAQLKLRFFIHLRVNKTTSCLMHECKVI